MLNNGPACRALASRAAAGFAPVRPPIPQVYGLYIVFTLIVTSLVLAIDDLPVATQLGLGLVLLTFALGHPDRPGPAPEQRGADPLRLPSAAAVAVGLALCLPVALYLGLTWTEEFAHSGDRSTHLGYFGNAKGIWSLSQAALLLPLLPLTVATWLLWRWRYRGAAVVLAALAVWAWAPFGDFAFGRYPTLGYVLRVPISTFSILFTDQLPVGLDHRLANALSVPVWLFILRPLLFREWPDWRLVPVAGLLLYQPMVVYYITSSYLEPWCLVFVLLSIESLMRDGEAGAARACLLVGLAAMVKEPVILLLPFLWLAGRPWRPPASRFWSLTAAAVAASGPFVVYYVFRRHVGDPRPVSLTPEQFVSLENWERLAFRLTQEWGSSGMLLLGAALAVTLTALLFHRRRRWQIACLSAGGIALWLLFMSDTIGVGWLGYTRFYMMPVPLLAAGLWALKYADDPPWWRQPVLALAATAAVVVGHAGPLSTALQTAAGPDAGRNFIEHHDAPIFLPIEELLTKARSAGALDGLGGIWVNRVHWTSYRPPVLSFKGDVEFGPLGELRCRCDEAGWGIMAAFVPMTGLNRHLDHPERDPAAALFPADRAGVPGPEDLRIWRQINSRRAVCQQELQTTCRHTFVSHAVGEVWGVFGIP